VEKESSEFATISRPFQ